MIDVPATLRAFARWQHLGEAGVAWVETLPQQVDAACARWGLVVDDGPLRHGYHGLVVPVRRDAEPLALKITWPATAVEEIASLRLWDGHAMVRLVEADGAAGALLLERLGERHLGMLELDEALPIIGGLLRELAVPVPVGAAPVSTRDVAGELSRDLPGRWEDVGRPFGRDVLDLGVDLARRCALGDPPDVLVNADLHFENVHEAQRAPWLALDPEVLRGDIEYQCGQLLWSRLDEFCDDAAIRDGLSTLVDAAGLDPPRAHDWALLRTLDYWLWGLANGLTEDPPRCARLAGGLR